MTSEFLVKVCRMGTVDTATYRYHLFEYADRAVIRRIRIALLGTTAALDWDNWQDIKTYWN